MSRGAFLCTVSWGWQWAGLARALALWPACFDKRACMSCGVQDLHQTCHTDMPALELDLLHAWWPLQRQIGRPDVAGQHGANWSAALPEQVQRGHTTRGATPDIRLRQMLFEHCWLCWWRCSRASRPCLRVRAWSLQLSSNLDQ